MPKFRIYLFLFFISLFIVWSSVEAAPGDTTADAVLGQVNFSNNSPNGGGAVSATGLDWPYGMAIDPINGRLYVAEYHNNRVMSWPSAESFANGAAADIVIGQSNFTSTAANHGGSVGANGFDGPVGVAVDQHTGRLYVSDYLNHRVLSFKAPLTTGAVADRVLGQPDFTSNAPNNGGISDKTLRYPWGVSVDFYGRPIVADYGNNRVLVYSANYADPSYTRVFGQPNATSSTPNNGGISANSLSSPTGVLVPLTSSVLFVADNANNRVLAYDLDATGNAAFLVLGQAGSFTTNTSNKGGLGAQSLWAPTELATDHNYNFYVADRMNNRVLRFDLTNISDDTADQVFGQPNFTSNTANNGGVSANSMSTPYAVTVTPGLDLLVSDRTNHRVLRYDAPAPQPKPQLVMISPQTVAVGGPSFRMLIQGSGFSNESTVLWNGQPRTTTFLNGGQLEATIPASDIAQPFAATVRVVNPLPGGTSVGIFNVTGYEPMAGDSQADRLLGQPDFVSREPYNWQVGGLSPRGIKGPQGLAVDPTTGRLYLADASNHRVLSWPSAASFANADPADLVLGQPDFFTYDVLPWTQIDATVLHVPEDVAVDENSNVFVADGLNNRVLVFYDPANTDTVADMVFGQPNFTSNNINNGGISANSMYKPHNVEIDDGTLYVNDHDNHRLLIYYNALTSDRTADVVIGQPDFSSGTIPGPATPTNLGNPRGLALDSNGRVYLSDYSHNRVIVFEPPFSNGQAATFVLGQPDLYSNGANNGGLSAYSLNGPTGIVIDQFDNVFVGDYLNNRVLTYYSPVANDDAKADLVFGQINFSSGQNNQGGPPTASTLYEPNGLALGLDGDLIVADGLNHRVLVYETPVQAAFSVFLPAVLK